MVINKCMQFAHFTLYDTVYTTREFALITMGTNVIKTTIEYETHSKQ